MKNRNSFLTVVELSKSKIKALASLVSGEAPVSPQYDSKMNAVS